MMRRSINIINSLNQIGRILTVNSVTSSLRRKSESFISLKKSSRLTCLGTTHSVSISVPVKMFYVRFHKKKNFLTIYIPAP